MNDTVALIDLPAGSRKRDAEATRAAILEAAKTQFALLGYDCTVLRDIAREAGADVALVKRYFGGKEALFLEALKASFGTDDVRAWDRATFAHEAATVWRIVPTSTRPGPIDFSFCSAPRRRRRPRRS